MNPQAPSRETLLDDILGTADDRRLSRSERKALRAVLSDMDLGDHDRLWLEQALIEAVAEQLRDPRDAQLVRWLGDTLGLLRHRPMRQTAPSRALFGPEDPMVETVVSVLSGARRSVDVAMFTITDDRISEALLAAHQRGVRVRIVSDGAKAHDPGSDAWSLDRAGVPLRLDPSPDHMHHKFAVVDAAILINGSYNWTRAADDRNRENFTLSEEPALVRRYERAFALLREEVVTVP